MSRNAAHRDVAVATRAALLEWPALSDALLRGLVHALNNRLTALSAFAELAAMGEKEFSADRTLPAELTHLQRLSGLFRLLASEGEVPEALELGAVLDDATALHLHHPRMHAVHCEVERDVSHVAVRAPRGSLLRLLLLLIDTGKGFAEQRGHAATTLRLGAGELSVTVCLEGGSLTPGIAAMAAECGAVAEEVGDAVVIRLPSLTALRQEERTAREGSGRRHD